MINQETKLKYATTDPSLHFNHSEPTEPDWRQEHIRLLEIRDYDSAERLKAQNVISDECSDGECLSCNFLWCVCPHHSVNQLKLEHPGLRSLAECESEESEEAA